MPYISLCILELFLHSPCELWFFDLMDITKMYNCVLICLQYNVEWKMTLTTRAMMIPCQMENWSVPQQSTITAHRELLSMMFLAASHFVPRVNTSHGKKTENVFARTQIWWKGNKVEVYLGEPTAKMTMIQSWSEILREARSGASTPARGTERGSAFPTPDLPLESSGARFNRI